MATRVQGTTAEQSIAQSLPIFETVNKNRDLLRTEGTFTIVVQERLSIKPRIIFEGTYKDGQAYYDGEILPEYSVYLYPNGYFGVSSRLISDSTTKVTLAPAQTQAGQIRLQQINYINSKIGVRVIDNPKDGINAAV